MITAAHCVTKADTLTSRGWTRAWRARKRKSIFIRLGEFNFETEEETEASDYEVHGLEIHPHFVYQKSPFLVKNDIAIITLDK